MKLRNKIVALFLTVACAFGLAVAGNATKVNAAEETVVCDDAAPVEEPVVVEQIAEEKA